MYRTPPVLTSLDTLSVFVRLGSPFHSVDLSASFSYGLDSALLVFIGQAAFKEIGFAMPTLHGLFGFGNYGWVLPNARNTSSLEVRPNEFRPYAS
jgi:hypothetical protein